MKKTILLSLATFLTLYARDISFIDAKPNPTHKLVTDTNEILSFNQILKEPIDSVVNISVKFYSKQQYQISPLMQDPFFQNFFGNSYRQIPQERLKRALGSGVILSKDGYIVTNNHVIMGADEITVSINGDNKEYNAKLIGKDKGSDLAVIKIDVNKDLKPITLSHNKDVHIGDVVFAIGNPFGVGETVTQGIVSALNKHGMGINQYENFIQTDASINPGNSGGALVDSRGTLIGINAAILSQSGGNHGVGFSIPVDMVRNIVTKLIENGKVNRGYLGIGIAPISQKMQRYYSEKHGAIITYIDRGSTADMSDLKRGDLIYKVNDTKVDSPSQLQHIIANISPGKQVSLYIERDKKEIAIEITLDARR